MSMKHPRRYHKKAALKRRKIVQHEKAERQAVREKLAAAAAQSNA